MPLGAELQLVINRQSSGAFGKPRVGTHATACERPHRINPTKSRTAGVSTSASAHCCADDISMPFLRTLRPQGLA
ncbi:unnamed protein product, partial [Iphiclides podalirius]